MVEDQKSIIRKINLVFLFCIMIVGFSYGQDVYNGKIRIKLSPEANETMLLSNAAIKTKALSVEKDEKISLGLKSVDVLNETYRVKSIRRLFPHAGIHEAKQVSYGLHLWYEIDLDEHKNIKEVAQKYGLDSHLEIAEPVYAIRGEMNGVATLASVINDPDFNLQWHYKNTGQSGGTPGADIRLPEAWTVSTGRPEVVVAVIDGGVDHKHEDINFNMWINRAEYNGRDGIDDDGNGYIDDIYGYNFVRGYSYGIILPTSHGTHVAGTIAAVSNNGVGVSGIAGGNDTQRGVSIMTCQIFLEGENRSSYGEEAIAYAANNGAVILQNSWGYIEEGAFPKSMETAINYFIDTAGKDASGRPLRNTPMAGGIVIFAAGNNNSYGNWYPARYNRVLSVASINHYGKRAYYSNYGEWVNISAPGGDTREKRQGGVYSTLPNNKYGYLQGTSMACPHVSGVAALILSKFGNENYTPAMLRERLLITTTSLAEFDPDDYRNMGSGLLNAENALQPNNGISPNAINDIHASDPLSTSILLSWTAPWDADNQKANSYKIAVSKNPVTTNNFNNAETIVAINHAKPAGDLEKYRISGFLPDNTYYAAVRSSDLWGNQSDISNVITFVPVNHPPQSDGMTETSIRDVGPDKTIDLNLFFSDIDGDKLAFTGSVSNSLAQISIDDNSMTIHPVSAGTASIQITATDPFGLTVSDSFELTILENSAPILMSPNTSVILQPHKSIELNLLDYFSDPEKDDVIFTLDTPSTLANVDITDSLLKITAVEHGSANLSVTGMDTYGAKSEAFTVNLRIDPYLPDKPGKLLIFPVPVESLLNYSFVLESDSDVEIRVINSVGILFFKTAKIHYLQGSHAATIDLSEWPKEIYLIQLVINGILQDTKKMLK